MLDIELRTEEGGVLTILWPLHVYRLLEAIVVIGIFLKLGTPMIALSTFITVVTYFIFTVAVTKWRYVGSESAT